jgi:hypothetical protein
MSAIYCPTLESVGYGSNAGFADGRSFFRTKYGQTTVGRYAADCSARLRADAHYLFARRFSASSNHPRLNVSTGMLDMYGLMSRIGVPSSISTP